jgi:hypothetical protein
MSDHSINSRFTPIADHNASVERTCAELLIYSGEIGPEQVTALLNLNATKMIVRGKQAPPNSRGQSVVGHLNAWFLSSESEVRSKDLRSHLDWLIARLQPRSRQLIELQREPGVKMYVFCPWWISQAGGGGPTLWPEQMRGLADLNLECTIAFADYSE